MKAEGGTTWGEKWGLQETDRRWGDSEGIEGGR